MAFRVLYGKITHSNLAQSTQRALFPILYKHFLAEWRSARYFTQRICDSRNINLNNRRQNE